MSGPRNSHVETFLKWPEEDFQKDVVLANALANLIFQWF